MISKKVFWVGGIVGLIILISLVNLNKNPEVSPSQYSNPISVPPTLDIVENNKADCHPSYEGVCLKPNASDYDCAGSSGNGPYYTGRVRVVGPDVFGLDRDHDGWGCE